MKKIKRKKIGLVLGSGGAKGLAHIGVIKILEKEKIPIDFIAGSSIGALVGAHYAIYKDIKKLEKLALSVNWKTAFKIFDPSFKGIEGVKVQKLLNKWYGNRKFSDLKIPLVVVATDLLTGEELDIKSGNLAKAIRASMSVPAVFTPVKYQKRLLADGGLSNPLPVNIVKKMGADIIIAVNLDSNKFEDDFDKKSLSIPMVSLRALNIVRYNLSKQSARFSDVLLEPKIRSKIGLIGWNQFFDIKKNKKIIDSGKKIAEQNILEIKKFLEE